MREYKFRAWDKVNKKMLYGVDPFRVHITDRDAPLSDMGVHRDNCAFMQYIGLKDKNGVEIYEGDIINFESYVVYEDAQYDAMRWGGDQGPKEPEEVEVTGNIYENDSRPPMWSKDYIDEMNQIEKIIEEAVLLENTEKGPRFVAEDAVKEVKAVVWGLITKAGVQALWDLDEYIRMSPDVVNSKSVVRWIKELAKEVESGR